MTETRGRKPLLPENRKPPQATLKINETILPFVQELKSYLKKGLLTPEHLQNLFDVLEGKATDSEIRLKLVQRYDLEHLKAVKLQGHVDSLRASIRSLKSQLNELKHQEHGCQMIKKSGQRCTRPAKVKRNWRGIEINVCLQHNKKVTYK